MPSINKLSELIVTFFYIGKIKYCPGTFGSLVAFPLCYLISYYSFANGQVISLPTAGVTTVVTANLLCCSLLLIIGTFFSSIYIRYKGQEDPKEVVIDEVVGQMLTIILTSISVLFVSASKITGYLSEEAIYIIFLFLMPFILFRFCDIVKPWPINWLDKNIKGGVGIMLDDILAAVFAAVLQYAIIFTLIDWFE